MLDTRGKVSAATTSVRDTLLDPEMLTAATQDASWLVLDDVHGVDGRVRVLATPFETADGTFVVVVGSSLENRDDAVHGLLTLLLVVGPAALLVASLLGYGLATPPCARSSRCASRRTSSRRASPDDAFRYLAHTTRSPDSARP